MVITPGSRYYLVGPPANAARMGYAALTPAELAHAVDQLGIVLRQHTGEAVARVTT